jgi:hypothetical protein
MKNNRTNWITLRRVVSLTTVAFIGEYSLVLFTWTFSLSATAPRWLMFVWLPIVAGTVVTWLEKVREFRFRLRPVLVAFLLPPAMTIGATLVYAAFFENYTAFVEWLGPLGRFGSELIILLAAISQYFVLLMLTRPRDAKRDEVGVQSG